MNDHKGLVKELDWIDKEYFYKIKIIDLKFYIHILLLCVIALLFCLYSSIMENGGKPTTDLPPTNKHQGDGVHYMIP